MPVRRIARLKPPLVDHLTGAQAAEQPVLQEELPSPYGGRPGRGVTRGQPVLVEAPSSYMCLVERRAAAGRCRVAVPATIGPLPLHKGFGKPLHPRIVGEAEPATDGERVALDR